MNLHYRDANGDLKKHTAKDEREYQRASGRGAKINTGRVREPKIGNMGRNTRAAKINNL